MKFYDCATAPSSRLVRMFIAEKGLDIPVQQVDLRGGEHLSEPFRSINPYCTVPVIETADGQRFTSTQGCWRYLEEIHPDPALLGRSEVERARIADLVWRIDIDGFHAAAEALRNAAKGMKDRALTGPVNVAQIPDLAERGKARTQRFLDGLDGLFGDDAYLAGDRFSAADIIGFCTVDFAGWLKLTLPDGATRARDWYRRVAGRPSARL